MANRTVEIKSFIVGTLGFALILSLVPVTSTAQLGQQFLEEADAHFDAQRFEESIPLYREHLREEPNDGRAWFYLGYAYMDGDDDALAIECFRKSIANKFGMLNSQYNIACGFSKLGDEQRAVAALEKAIDLGYTQTRRLTGDIDLEPIRNTREFQQLVTRTQNPIQHYPGGRLLTNLVGVWSVAKDDGSIGRATGNALAKGFSQQFDLDFGGKRYLHLNLQFSASENKWYAAGGDTDGTAYTGAAEVSEFRIKVDGKQADGVSTRLSIVWSDEEHADLKIEDRIDGSWQSRPTTTLTETTN